MLKLRTSGKTESIAGQSQDAVQWHAQASEDVLHALEASRPGLTSADAEARLNRYGANVLTPPKPRSMLARMASHFHNVLIYVLLAAAAVTAALGHWIDSGVIAAYEVVQPERPPNRAPDISDEGA